MSDWRFRLNGVLSCQIAVASEAGDSYPLAALDGRVVLTVHTWDHVRRQRLSFDAHGYVSKDDAESGALRFREAAVVGAALDWLSLKFPDPPIIFQGALLEATLDARGGRLLAAGDFDQRLATGLSLAQAATERQLICAGLISDSIILPNHDAQLLMRVSAIEALCDQGELPTTDKIILNALADDVSARPDLTPGGKDVVIKALRNVKGLTARAAYRAKILDLLDAQAFKTFERLYSLRSSLVHDGKGKGALGDAAHDALSLASRLLREDLRRNPRP